MFTTWGKEGLKNRKNIGRKSKRKKKTTTTRSPNTKTKLVSQDLAGGEKAHL